MRERWSEVFDASQAGGKPLKRADAVRLVGGARPELVEALTDRDEGLPIADGRRLAHEAAKLRAEWWRRRCKGFLGRPWDAPDCGAEALVQRCDAPLELQRQPAIYDPSTDELWYPTAEQGAVATRCGHVQAFARRCDQRALCEQCAGVRKSRDYTAMKTACVRVWERARRRPFGSLLTWKLITVTVDARDEDDLPARMARLRAQVKRFRRWLRRYTHRYGKGKVPKGALRWFRGAEVVSYEVATGRALKGHPHCHMLVLAPHIDKAELRRWWHRNGCQFIDLRAVRSDGVRRVGQGVLPEVRTSGKPLTRVEQVEAGVREVLKYIVKPPAGCDPEVAATLAARIDEAIYGRRLLERCGELRDPDIYSARVPVCPGCGESGHRRVEGIERWELDEQCNPIVRTRAGPLPVHGTLARRGSESSRPRGKPRKPSVGRVTLSAWQSRPSATSRAAG